jgi:hypothetical protein
MTWALQRRTELGGWRLQSDRFEFLASAALHLIALGDGQERQIVQLDGTGCRAWALAPAPMIMEAVELWMPLEAPRADEGQGTGGPVQR